MAKRPMCLLCFLMVLSLGALELMGIPLIRGNPLPLNVQEQIEAYPGSMICGEVEQYENTEFSQSVYLKKTYLIHQSKKFPIENVRIFLKKEEDLKPGMRILVKGTLKRVEGPANPGGFDSQHFYACRHIYYFMKNAVLQKKTAVYSGYRQLLLEIKESCRQILKEAAGKDAPVFCAMTLGDKQELDPETQMRYQLAGIIHILAISGVKTLKLDIPLVPEIRINWAFVPLHIAIIYILKLCLDEEIIPRCRFPCSRGYFKKCINWQNKKSFSVSQSYRKSLKNQQKEK